MRFPFAKQSLRRWAEPLLTQVVVNRLSETTEHYLRWDGSLHETVPVCGEAMEQTRQAELARRAMPADSARFAGRHMRSLLKEPEALCQHGCGVRATWSHAVFECRGTELTRLRSAYAETVEEARVLMSTGVPHDQLCSLCRRLEAGVPAKRTRLSTG